MCLLTNYLDYLFIIVHCRKRPSKFGQLKCPSTSANMYWQFEKESDGRSGEPLNWGERCRIKHLPTRRYLAVVLNDSPEKRYKVFIIHTFSTGHKGVIIIHNY